MTTERKVQKFDNEERKKEYEELFGSQDEEIFQSRFGIVENFNELRIAEGKPDKLVVRKEKIQKEIVPKFATNISSIESIYPWLLVKEGQIDGPLPQWEIRGGLNKPALEGTLLHQVDAMFSVVNHGIPPSQVREYLPNENQEVVDRIARSVGGTNIGGSQNPEEIRANLMQAWDKYKNQPSSYSNENFTLQGFGVTSSNESKMYMYSNALDSSVSKLADAWTRELVKPERNRMTWEFREGTITQREVLVYLNIEGPDLQFRTKIDSISRREGYGGRVTSQAIDLKTGNIDYNSRLEQEVHLRQSQMMSMTAERFTSDYLVAFESLKSQDRPYMVSTMHDSTAYEGRVHLAAYRNFDKSTGDFILEPVRESETGRKDFHEWLSWYGVKIHEYRPEVSEIRRTRPNYKLSAVNVRANWKPDFSLKT